MRRWTLGRSARSRPSVARSAGESAVQPAAPVPPEPQVLLLRLCAVGPGCGAWMRRGVLRRCFAGWMRRRRSRRSRVWLLLSQWLRRLRPRVPRGVLRRCFGRSTRRRTRCRLRVGRVRRWLLRRRSLQWLRLRMCPGLSRRCFAGWMRRRRLGRLLLRRLHRLLRLQVRRGVSRRCFVLWMRRLRMRLLRRALRLWLPPPPAPASGGPGAFTQLFRTLDSAGSAPPAAPPVARMDAPAAAPPRRDEGSFTQMLSAQRPQDAPSFSAPREPERAAPGNGVRGSLRRCSRMRRGGAAGSVSRCRGSRSGGRTLWAVG